MIVIPSARRPFVLASKTLPFLEANEIEPAEVEICVPDAADLREYTAALPTRWVPRLHIIDHDPEYASIENLGVRPRGLGAARNAIARAHEGQWITEMDDDLRGLICRTDEKHTKPIALREVIARGETAADTVGARLWGVYAVRNPYFMKPRTTTKLAYVCGGLFGLHPRGDDADLVTLDDKEDFERSVRCYLADGAIARLDDVAMLTDGYRGAGGMQASRTPQRVTASAEVLVGRYPDLVTLNTTKRSGWAEVRLADRRT